MKTTDSMPDPAPRLRGALAIELAGDDGLVTSAAALPQAAAGALAAHVARDLASFAPGAAMLDCVTVAAHYDPVELLRPGWPLHARLDEYAARAPRTAGTARIIAFGSHEGALPEGLQPDAAYLGGPLRLLPFVLGGAATDIDAVGAVLEAELMERGMAGAATALAVQETFGLRVEHARYLTVHDLCAMTALQYEHAGLAPLWPLIETALLSPARDAWLDAPPEPPVHYADGEARLALLSPPAWRLRHAPDTTDEDRLARAFRHFEARQRQYADVLRAHGIPVTFVDCPGAPADAL